mmetsp:Transcript_43480/g.94710  ORF Transcript_43480/g.94710 Transcript_43480/m.94710 type:complete len:269 (-) Transcript_43480:213-1019(-)
MPGLSVIVPTYNEVDNIRPLCERLFKSLKDAGIEPAELVVMDDESKGSEQTEKIVNELAKEGYGIRGHFRKKTEGRGLSSAVMLGFDKAKYPVMLCMDADLQHEPESVPAVADPVLKGRAEFSVGSRNVAGGGVGFEWSFLRRVISFVATSLALGVSSSTDPMSGFFCTTKDVYARGRERCNGIGWKVGLEIAARCQAKPLEDVPITFKDREAGESKLTQKETIQYVEQLVHLYCDRYGAGPFFGSIALLVLVGLFILYSLLSSLVGR